MPIYDVPSLPTIPKFRDMSDVEAWAKSLTQSLSDSAYARTEKEIWNKWTSLDPVTLTLTWDEDWHDLDLTVQTSSQTRWALINVHFTRTADFTNDFSFRRNGDTNACITLTSNQIGTSNYRVAAPCLVPLDSGQICEYWAPANTSTRSVVLYGYVEVF